MARTAALRLCDVQFAPVPATNWDADLRAFLDGETHGESLLHAIYDDVLDEPIPARLLEALRG